MIFRVDGANIHSLAMGHVYRCLKLAVHLVKTRGTEVRFVMRDYPEGVAKVREYGFPVTPLAPDMTLEEEVKTVAQMADGETLVTDVRRYGPEETATLRGAAHLHLAFDDLGGRDLCPHVLVNPSVLPKHRNYPELRSDVRYCLGLDYFLLGSHAAPPCERISREVYRALVTLGGADPDDYASAMLPCITPLAHACSFTFVLGPAYGNAAGFIDQIQAAGLPGRVSVLRDITDLPSLMTTFDMVITAGGDTCLESAWSGVPTAIAPTIEYEEETATHMEDLGVAVNLGDIKRIPHHETTGRLQALMDDFERRHTLSGKGRRLVDGHGADRITEVLERT
ncbi:PseG/SpsG family protein [Pseudodesulfovibrio sp.]|uniref:PseG/SpsG family protein n=1 Tax=unclassified Pseudodesulfovibrio TaxID=2661612 RepID=UPI003B009ED4